MATIPHLGSFTQISSQNDLKYSNERPLDNAKIPPYTTDLVEPHPQYPRDEDTTLAREEINSKTFVNLTSYDPARFQETFGTLMQYVVGTPIRVTYYRQIISDNGEKTAFGDVDLFEDDVHSDLEQILNFEMRPESQFNFNWDSEKNEASFNGEAITYPGFEPHIGDMFVYKIHDAIGLFQVVHIEPLSIRQGAYHRIGFVLRSRLDEETRKSLMHRSKSTVVFDLEKFLSGNLVLLQYESYLDLEKLRETRISLAKYYNMRFFDPMIESYISPDGVYDPYLVKYMLKKISTQTVRYRPMQLIIVRDYDFTLWSLFTEDRHMPLDMVHPAYEIVNKVDGIFGTQFNGLINKSFIRIVNSTNNDDTAAEGLGSRVATGTMNGQITKAVPKDEENNNNNSFNNKERVITYANTQSGNVIRTVRNKEGEILEQVTLPPLPIQILDEAYGPEKEEHIQIDNTIIHKYEYYYKNIRSDRNLTTFKEPHCSHPCPPCMPNLGDFSNDTEQNKNNKKMSDSYILSWAFYNGFTNQMTTLERLVYDWVTTGVVNAHEVVTLVGKFRVLSDDVLYKFGPIYLHLIDVAIRSIT